MEMKKTDHFSNGSVLTTTGKELTTNHEFAELLELRLNEILEKFGAGNHKPGSGSAAALNGILSCQLILTVLQLTIDPKRSKNYGHLTSDLNRIRKDLVENIIPRLEKLFQEDSVQFGLTIDRRKQRDAEKDVIKRKELDQQSLNELKKSTELPIELAEIGLRLAEYSLFILDNGFKSARGDSGVAMNNALAMVSGSLYIISLNLRSFPTDTWTESIRLRQEVIANRYSVFFSEHNDRMIKLNEESKRHSDYLAEIHAIKNHLLGSNGFNNKQIEDLARRTQNAMWEYREFIWSDNLPESHIDILDPQMAIKKILKFSFKESSTLGVTESNEEIAGIIDRDRESILVSDMHIPEVKNFTAAHELGHGLLHDKVRLHRDIPLDGSQREIRSMEEMQADKFAACFLMPQRILASKFKEIFHTEQMEITAQSAFAIAYLSPVELKKKIKTRRDFSRLIASLDFFNQVPIKSLAATFNVSVEAMAIRLEELNLIKF